MIKTENSPKIQKNSQKKLKISEKISLKNLKKLALSFALRMRGYFPKNFTQGYFG